MAIHAFTWFRAGVRVTCTGCGLREAEEGAGHALRSGRDRGRLWKGSRQPRLSPLRSRACALRSLPFVFAETNPMSCFSAPGCPPPLLRTPIPSTQVLSARRIAAGTFFCFCFLGCAVVLMFRIEQGKEGENLHCSLARYGGDDDISH